MKRQPPEAKFRTQCVWCGEKSPRPTTAHTQAKWMKAHVEYHAGLHKPWVPDGDRERNPTVTEYPTSGAWNNTPEGPQPDAPRDVQIEYPHRIPYMPESFRRPPTPENGDPTP